MSGIAAGLHSTMTDGQELVGGACIATSYGLEVQAASSPTASDCERRYGAAASSIGHE